MRNTTDTLELSLDKLDHVAGGRGASLVGATGDITFGLGTKNSFVSWPGTVGGMDGTWTMSTQSGVTWRPA
jgi:hypothetical protein